MSKSQINPDVKKIATVVRALVTSRKPPCHLNDILREYADVEGESLPFFRMGYKNAEELLDASNEFIIKRLYGGQTTITAKFSEKSSHIACLVHGQKKSNTSRVTAPVKKTSYNSYYGRNNANAAKRFAAFNNNHHSRGDHNNNRSHTLERENAALRQENVALMQLRQGMRELERKYEVVSQQKVLNESTLKKEICMQVQAQEERVQEMLLARIRNQERLYQELLQRQEERFRNQSMKYEELKRELEKKARQDLQEQRDNAWELANRVQQNLEQQRVDAWELGNIAEQNLQQRHVSASGPVPSMNKAQATNNNNENWLPLAQPGTNTTVKGRSVQDRLIVSCKQPDDQMANLQIAAPTQSVPPAQSRPKNSTSLSSRVKRFLLPSSHKKSVQYRLNVPKQEDMDDDEFPPPVAVIGDDYFEEPPEIDTPKFADPVKALLEFCATRGYDEPTFEFFKMSPNRKKFQCQITVNSSIHSAYPDDFPTKAAAKVATATKILRRLLTLEARQKLPPCSDYEDELLEKLYTEIKRHPHGMFASKVPDWFENKYKQLIPEHWWALVHMSPQFIAESTADDNIILFAGPEIAIYPVNEQFERPLALELNCPELPWSAPEWTVCITRCVSTVEVWGRLSEPASVAAFDKFQANLEREMIRQTAKPLYITPHQVYIAKMADCWHRVRVREQQKQRQEALCFLVDSGDLCWIPFADIYRCPLVFLEFAKQAIKFQIHGLKDLANCEQACEALRNNLPDLTLTARVCSSEEQYLEDDSIEVELFDEASLFSVMDLIQQHFHAPKLGEKLLKKVKITQIGATGCLYLQVPDEMLLVDQLIEKDVSTEVLLKLSPGELECGQLYLISDETFSVSRKWYRATLVDDCPTQSAKELDVLYVDYGVTRKVAANCIFDLESINKTLSVIPHQAIKCELHDVPPITDHIVGRLRALLPQNCEALVKQNAVAEVPLITVYHRVLETDFLSNVNDIIRVEDELQSADWGEL